MMIAIATAFPWWTPRTTAHVVFHLSNVAQSLLPSSLSLPHPPPAGGQGRRPVVVLVVGVYKPLLVGAGHSVPACPLRGVASSYTNAVWGGGGGGRAVNLGAPGGKEDKWGRQQKVCQVQHHRQKIPSVLLY
jgi:hypothetical protein